MPYFAETNEIDYSDIETKYHVEEPETNLDHVVVVDGVPLIDESKLDRLIARLTQHFRRKETEVNASDIHVPWDATLGKDKGFVFVELLTAEAAASAIAVMDNHAFGAKHILEVNQFTDIERYNDLDVTFEEPEPEEDTPTEHLRSWLTEPKGRDQFATYQADEVLIHWHGKPSQSGIAYERPADKTKWTDRYVTWSPRGTFFATLHQQGIPHPSVLLIDFSPCENYLVTWSHRPISADDPIARKHFSHADDGNQIAVWDIKSGRLLRTFPVEQEAASEEGSRAEFRWPTLKWSPDDNMVLHGKKSIKVDGVVDMEWCPGSDNDGREHSPSTGAGSDKENMLAYWVPEMENQSARVVLMTFPSRVVVRQKNLFNVTNCSLHWHDRGDYLCVKVDRYTKTKKTLYTTHEIFRIRSRDVPVEVIELQDKALEFAWEPDGNRFAVITTNDLSTTPMIGALNTDVSFFEMDPVKGEFRLLRRLTTQTSNTLRWGPHGRFIVLATVGSSSRYDLQIWDLGAETGETGRKESHGGGSSILHMATFKHYGVTDVEWDPSGRYLATSASAWKHQVENGYCIWDLGVNQVARVVQDHFKQFLWRPRPRTFLSKEKRLHIEKQLREYGRYFDDEDAAENSQVSSEIQALRLRLLNEWNTWRKSRQSELAPTDRLLEKGKSNNLQEIEVWEEIIVTEIVEVVLEE